MKNISLILISGLLIALLTSFSDSVAVVNAQEYADTGEVEIYLEGPDGKEITTGIDVVAKKQFKLKVKIRNAENLGALGANFNLDISDLSIVNVSQKFSFCKTWDKLPEYNEGGIEIMCAQGSHLQAEGEILEIDLVMPEGIERTQLGLADIVYVNKTGDLVEDYPDRLIAIYSKGGLIKTSGNVGDSPSLLFILTNVVILLVIILAITLVFKKQYIKTKK